MQLSVHTWRNIIKYNIRKQYRGLLGNSPIPYELFFFYYNGESQNSPLDIFTYRLASLTWLLQSWFSGHALWLCFMTLRCWGPRTPVVPTLPFELFRLASLFLSAPILFWDADTWAWAQHHPVHRASQEGPEVREASLIQCPQMPRPKFSEEHERQEQK